MTNLRSTLLTLSCHRHCLHAVRVEGVPSASRADVPKVAFYSDIVAYSIHLQDNN